MRMNRILLACSILMLMSTARIAGGIGIGLTAYSYDFEAPSPVGITIGDGWLFFANVFEDGSYLFGYGPFAAPNGPQISAIVTDQGGLAQGDQQLSVYSDYECCAAPAFPPGFPPTGHQSPTGLGLVETNVFQEQLIGSANVGERWKFGFDAKRGNIEGSSTALAFIKILDPDNGYSLTEIIIVDTTWLSFDWLRYSMDIIIGDWSGQLLQFGFLTNAGNYEGSGNYYDNVDFSRTAIPLPGALLLLSSGLLGLATLRSKPV